MTAASQHSAKFNDRRLTPAAVDVLLNSRGDPCATLPMTKPTKHVIPSDRREPWNLPLTSAVWSGAAVLIMLNVDGRFLRFAQNDTRVEALRTG